MNLYKLELMKIRVSAYLWGIVGIFICLLALGNLFLFVFQLETGAGGISKEGELFANWNGLLVLITALTFACFSVFSATIAAKVIVSDYCGGTAVALLSYPISRKIILRAKCLIVCTITAVCSFISNVLVISSMYVTAQITRVCPQMNTEHFVFTVLVSSILTGMLSSAVGIISAVFGWGKGSAVATIVCALIIVCVTTNFIAISLNNIIFIMLEMSLFFVIIANVMYHILVKKIVKMEI